MKRNLLLIVLSVFVSLALLLFGPTISIAKNLTLSWDAPTTNSDGSPLTDLSGYFVYSGIESGNYADTVDVGNVTEYIIPVFPDNTYCFAVTAYDTSGNESDYSNEVCLPVGIDTDGDLTPDFVDNCRLTANSGQQDTDVDGYGNMCDADLDNDGFVAPSDFNIFKEAWGSDSYSSNWNADADFNSDGFVNPSDFNIFKSRWGTVAPWE